MVKKAALILTLIAGLLMPQVISAPCLTTSKLETYVSSENSYHKKLIEYAKKCYKMKKILTEEKELLEKDEIYKIINSFYDTLNPPEYITKKFIRTLIRVESVDDPRAINRRSGARGLGQLMWETWYEVMKENYWKNVFMPEKNIEATIKYLSEIDRMCKKLNPSWEKLSNKRKIELIAAAYNGGIGALKEEGWRYEKMSKETRGYIPKIYETSKKFIPSAEIYEPVSLPIFFSSDVLSGKNLSFQL